MKITGQHDNLSMLMNNLRNNDTKELNIPGLKLIPYEYKNKTSKFDLILFAAEAVDKLLFTVEYSTKLFREATVGRFITYFINIIKEIIENRAQRISDINFLTEKEKREILFDFNETEKKYLIDKTIHELFEEQVERRPDHIAVVDKKRRRAGGGRGNYDRPISGNGGWLDGNIKSRGRFIYP